MGLHCPGGPSAKSNQTHKLQVGETVFTCPSGRDGWSGPASPLGLSQHFLLWADPSPRTSGSRAQGPGFKGALEMPQARTLPCSIPASRSPSFHKWGDPSNPAHLSEAGDPIITSLQGRGRMELIVTLTLLQVRTEGAVGGWRPRANNCNHHLPNPQPLPRHQQCFPKRPCSPYTHFTDGQMRVREGNNTGMVQLPISNQRHQTSPVSYDMWVGRGGIKGT